MPVLGALVAAEPNLRAGAPDARQYRQIEMEALNPATTSARAAAWLERRRQSLKRCSGTGTIRSLSASNSRLDSAIIRPMSAPVQSCRHLSAGAPAPLRSRHSRRRRGRVEQRRICHSRRRDQGPVQIQCEGCAQPLATGPLDQAEPGPAAPAQAMGRPGTRRVEPASEATRWRCRRCIPDGGRNGIGVVRSGIAAYALGPQPMRRPSRGLLLPDHGHASGAGMQIASRRGARSPLTGRPGQAICWPSRRRLP